MGDLGGGLGGHALCRQAVKERRRQFPGDSHDHEGEEEAHGKDHAGVLEGGPDARTRPPLARREAVHDAHRVRRYEETGGKAVQEKHRPKKQETEVHRHGDEQPRGSGRSDHAPGGKRTRPIAISKPARGWSCDQDAGSEGQHVDAGPQRSSLKVVAVQG